MMSDNVASIKISDFDYPLADDRIAKHPLAERDLCKMLVRNGKAEIAHHLFKELPDFLPADSLMICNNARVINARIHFQKPTGATIEIFCLEPALPTDYAQMFQTTSRCRWNCLIGNLKRWKEGIISKAVEIEGVEAPVNLTARKIGTCGNAWIVEFEWDNSEVNFATLIDAVGNIPIPPYLNRESEKTDSDDYQTVYSKIKGSVAAPTAGLHFTDRVMAEIARKGITTRELTLHVGAGTFQPVKSETIGEHPMHTEVFTIDEALLVDIIDRKQSGSPIVAVGTTSVRTIESLPYLGQIVMENPEADAESLHVGQWTAYNSATEPIDASVALNALLDYMRRRGLARLTASTAIMIAPGFNWKLVDAVVTNFHQPQSTLLLLVSSFIERGEDNKSGTLQWRKMYDEALAQGYRFLSYGDSSLLTSW